MSNNDTSYGYLKKKKLYEMLKALVDTDLRKLKDAKYRFFRGSEWLECSSDNNKVFKLYHSRRFVSLDISIWDEEKENYVEIDRITYQLIDGQLIKNYQRTEAAKATQEIKLWLEKEILR